jgi:ferric-dicitrate binding protein FerR (iron transport regulator)
MLLLAIAAVRAFIIPGPNSSAIVENEDGTQYRLAAGETLKTDVWTRLTLTFADGSRIEMQSQSELALEAARDGIRIRLAKGGVTVNAARQRSGIFMWKRKMSSCL